MAKTMARLKNGVVVNLEWVNDEVRETANLKDVGDLSIEVGDVYTENGFYRDNVKVLSFQETVHDLVNKYRTALDEIVTVIFANHNTSDIRKNTIAERKQAILTVATDMLTALEIIDVKPSE